MARQYVLTNRENYFKCYDEYGIATFTENIVEARKYPSDSPLLSRDEEEIFLQGFGVYCSTMILPGDLPD